ncbi:MAG: nuclear transport factor 2 family protein [Gammaproteobacteria bacterium]|nr:nuclear transport factor 2 family protein [Gammaproteobacteria bacterium]
MIQIIPNWHPVLVHFTIGLLVTAAGLFAAAALLRDRPIAERATLVARWNLVIGTAFATLTLAAGYRAYYTVAHDDPAHAAMLVHMKWAWIALVLFVIAAALAWRERARERGTGPILAMFLAAGTGALFVTGYLGAENVYRHGLGVMRLPAAEGPGHTHAHGGEEKAHGHSHETPAEPHAPATALPGAAAAPGAVVDAFHDALAGSDLDAARRLLDPQVQIFEGGNIERSAEEYAAHHMQSDAAFLKEAEVRLHSRGGGASGELAWIASESTIAPRHGNDGGVVSTETMVLRNSPGGWRIVHIHWSSRPLEGPAGHRH